MGNRAQLEKERHTYLKDAGARDEIGLDVLTCWRKISGFFFGN